MRPGTATHILLATRDANAILVAPQLPTKSHAMLALLMQWPRLAKLNSERHGTIELSLRA
jgi:hypothetical protein